MKITLKEYQDDAVGDVLVNLRKARKRWHDEGEKNAFSLTATMGAGKTVMAAAVFEALFFGSDEYDFEPDHGAVVLWFSDDPSLNEQSRHRLFSSSEKFSVSDLELVETTFNREKFEPGKVYFLNTQKLSKNSKLVKGYESGDENPDDAPRLMPDLRSFTIWDTIRNTIEDPELTLYLVLDEAHRGMSEDGANGVSGKQTIVKQLINGPDASIPGIPIVWGISATVDRFNKAIAGMKGRTALENIVIDPVKIQESGLIKDSIILDIPDSVGPYDTVLLRRAVEKIRAKSKAWDEYTQQQEDAKRVKPLLVFQVPNAPDHDDIAKAIDIILDKWPELKEDQIANVFGEHRVEHFGRYRIPYIEPQRVQETDEYRVLIAKDAISTGWDCPRAEVMVSFRSAQDKTHITQLLGRLFRTPLAMRIPGNEELNAIDCLLPHFHKNTVQEVVKLLTADIDDDGGNLGQRVLITPVDLTQNPGISDEVWAAFNALPSQTLPKRGPKPIKRLTLLAHELAADGILEDAGQKAHAEMHKVLDGSKVRYANEITAARESVLTVEGQAVKSDLDGKDWSFDNFVEKADYAVIEDAYQRAARMVSKDLAGSYCKHLAGGTDENPADETEYISAQTTVAALGLVPEIIEDLEREAEDLSQKWEVEHRVAIRGLSDDRQEAYRAIQEMSSSPQDIGLVRPNNWKRMKAQLEPDGSELALPTFANHLVCGEDGLYPCKLNSWELHVIDTELGRTETVAWYQNPSRPSQDSLGIAYNDGDAHRIVRPDFIFFSKVSGGKIMPSIVDPHGAHFSDSLPKLKGLAAYAETHGEHYARIDAVAEIEGVYKVVDLKNADVRAAVKTAASITDVYSGGLVRDYL